MSAESAQPVGQDGPHEKQGQGESAGAQILAEQQAHLQRTVTLQQFDLKGHLPLSVHVYANDEGRAVGVVARYPKGTPGTRQERSRVFQSDGTAWQPVQRRSKLPEYRAPEIEFQVRAGGQVILVEREPAVDTLFERGLVATTVAGGLLEWRTDHTEALRNAHVVICPTHDAYSWWLGRRLARKLIGIAASVKIVGLPNVESQPENYQFDVTAWFANGGLTDALLEAIRQAEVWNPDADDSDDSRPPDRNYGLPSLLAAAQAMAGPTSEPAAEAPRTEAEPPPDPLSHLLPQHRELIRASAISDEVAVEREYESITVKEKLKTLGFKTAQRNVPAFYLPLRSVTGELLGHQIRPDNPRINQSGKVVKYEMPAGSRMLLDVHPRVRSKLTDVKEDLWITEGVRKADSAVSHGLACIGLIGVWNWRGTNSDGGKSALPDWESIALNGRRVYIAFDSDVTTKAAVREALRRLVEFLKLRDAKVLIVHIPARDGAKVGLDDFFAQGGTVEQLLAASKSELPPKPEKPEFIPVTRNEYRVTPDGLVHVHYDPEGSETLILLANFTAEIRANISEDDGVTTTQHLELHVKRDGRERVVEVPSAEFGPMFWTTEKLDSTFVVTAGMGNRDHLRAAIQELSPEPMLRTIYTHTGWRAFGADWAFLHARGAIGARGEIPGIEVRLHDSLSLLVLPPPAKGAELKAAVTAVLAFLRVAPDRISFVLLALAFRAPLGRTDLSGHLSGASGTFKTELAALIQQFFGAKFSSRSLPGSWSSTGNALEAIAFYGMNVVMVVDDFVPQGGPHDSARIHREADRLMRAQGNNSGRQRMGADGRLRATRYPRGLILSTGEDTPSGQSLRARLCNIEVSPGDVSQPELTRCQADARNGLYAETMATFVMWLASRRTGLEERIRARVEELRAQVGEHTTARHRRTIDVIGQLYVAWEYFTEFAVVAGALDAQGRTALLERAWAALVEAGDEQNAAQSAFDPVEQFVTLLRSAVSAGEGHFADRDGGPPDGYSHEALGWQRTLDGSNANSTTWQARGPRIGWILDGELYLDPTAAYRAAQRMTDDVSRISIAARTLGKRLHDRGYLVSIEDARGRHTVRRMICGARHEVLHLRVSLLLGSTQSAQSPQTPVPEAVGADSGSDSWADRSTDRPTDSGPGPHGPIGPMPEGDAQGEWEEA